jgi:hypothetical protein
VKRAGLVKRDWAAVESVDRQRWTEVSAAEKIRISDELRKQVLAARPNWPTAEDRQADLEGHVRLAALLAKAGPG